MLRTLYDREPADWLDYLRIAVPDPGQLRILDSNVSTIGAEVDKAVWVGGPEPFIVHTEFVSGRKRDLPEVAFGYNTLLTQKYQVPVWSVIVLLRPAADGPELTGVLEKSFPGRGQSLLFRYEVIRIWLEPPEKLLKAGLAVLPLAPVSNVAPEQLEEVVTAVAERLKAARPIPQQPTGVVDGDLWGLHGAASSAAEQGEADYRGGQGDDLGHSRHRRVVGLSGHLRRGRGQGSGRGGAKGGGEPCRRGTQCHPRRSAQEAGRARTSVLLSLLAALGDLDRLNLLLDALLDAATWDDLLPLFHG